ncbi:MAG TPA: flagellin, partial [Candidatus Ozemobacteraceae bacterium]|nr:flagellin [Candidatus Ozemobacteraceae bacterium]
LTTDSRVSGLLNGIDLAFTSQAGQIAGTKGLQEGLAFTADLTFAISAGGVNTNIVISGGSARFGYSMEGIARSINDQVAGVLGLSAAVVDGQIRVSYERPATAAASIGTTIQIANATTNGVVDVLGIVNGTYSGFVQGQKNEGYKVWGFTNYATAAQAVTFRMNDGNVPDVEVTAYTSVTIVSSADLYKFDVWQATVNYQLATADVAVRVDQVGSTVAFTALRVGRENPDSAAAIRSVVSLDADAEFNGLFDIQDGTAMGSGDKNFRVHIVNNSPNFQIGGDPGQKMQVNFANMNADALGVQALDLTTVSAAAKSIARINSAIDQVSAERSKLGAFQNRLEYAISNIRNTYTNLSAAESRIRDADVAQEMIEFTRNQIVNQSGTAMLAQANLLPQGVLQLLS